MVSHAWHGEGIPTKTNNMSYSLRQNSHAISHKESLFLHKDLWLLCLVAFTAMMLSKAGTLLPGMSADDYLFALSSHSDNSIYNLIAQGRSLSALLSIAAGALNTSFAAINGFSFFLASAMISLAIAYSVTVIKYEQHNQAHHYLAAAFAATHPYLTSYFLFRMSLVSHAFIYATLFAALWLVAARRSLWRQAACVLLLAACSHISQIILILFAISGGAWSLGQYCHERRRGADFPSARYHIVSFIVILVLATVLYFSSSAITRSAWHVAATSDYTIHLHGGIFGTVRTAFHLAYEILFVNESIVPYWLKLWIFLTMAAAIAACVARSFSQGVACVVLLICGLLAAVSPLALSWGGFVTRTFSPAGLCMALVFSLACSGAKRCQGRGLVIVMSIPIACFCFIGAALFYQQLILTNWDQRTAAAIYERVAEHAGEGTPIRIVASWPVYKQPLSYYGPGINESAFLHDWAFPGLFAVATGAKPDVAAGARSICNGMPAWPNHGSMKRLDDGSMLVCMVH